MGYCFFLYDNGKNKQNAELLVPNRCHTFPFTLVVYSLHLNKRKIGFCWLPPLKANIRYLPFIKRRKFHTEFGEFEEVY